MKKTGVTVTLLALAVVAVVQVAKDKQRHPINGSMVLTSSAFEDGEPLPVEYTCDGENVSPPLEWANVPETARALVLIFEDPDAPFGTWTQWVVYNLPAELGSLPAGAEIGSVDYAMARDGTNTWLRKGYSGPCSPPVLREHTFFFHLYALDATLDLGEGARRKGVDRAMQGHILAEAVLTCTYSG